MAGIIIPTFGAMSPRTSPRLLDPTQAIVAKDVDLRRGALESLTRAAEVTTLPHAGDVKSIFRWGLDQSTDAQYWFAWTTDVDVVRTPTANDTSERIYYTGAGGPKATDSAIALGASPLPVAWYALGVPAAPDGPELEVTDHPFTAVNINGTTVTLTTQYPHRLQTGDKVHIRGFDVAAFNAENVEITHVDDTKFTITVGPPSPSAPSQLGGFYLEGPAESRAYTYTFRTGWNEEGPAAPPVLVTVLPGQLVKVKNMLTSTSTLGAGPYNITHKRVYRTVVGNFDTEYFQIAEVTLGVAQVTDVANAPSLVRPLKSLDATPPPESMRGICLMANGIGLGFSANTVHVSEAYKLYAWPSKYQHSTDFKIVGLATFGTFAAVLTKGTPYLLGGTSPGTLSLVQVKGGAACMSKRSIVSLDNGALYAGPDGLMFIDRGGVVNVTASLFTDRQWKALKPETMVGVRYGDAYIGTYTVAGVERSFLFAMGDPPLWIELSDVFDCAYYDESRGHMYFERGKKVWRFNDSADRKTFTWRSKEFEFPKPTNFTVGQVIAAGVVTLRLIVDGVERLEQMIDSDSPFKLPGGFKGRIWQVELEGTELVHKVALAHSVQELQQV